MTRHLKYVTSSFRMDWRHTRARPHIYISCQSKSSFEFLMMKNRVRRVSDTNMSRYAYRRSIGQLTFIYFWKKNYRYVSDTA